MTLLKHIDIPSILVSYKQQNINYSFIIITSSQNNALMNKILCSNYFKIDTVRHTPPDISFNTSVSTRHSRLNCNLHTGLSAIQEGPPIYQQ